MRYQVHIVYNGSCTEWIVIWSKIKYTGSSIWNYKCDFRSKLHETQFNYNSELPCLKILLQTSCCLHAKSVRSIIHPFPFVFNFLETKALKIYCTRASLSHIFQQFLVIALTSLLSVAFSYAGKKIQFIAKTSVVHDQIDAESQQIERITNDLKIFI